MMTPPEEHRGEKAGGVPRGKFVNVRINPATGKQIRGFAAMDPAKAKKMQSNGGKKVHRLGKAYVFGRKTSKAAAARPRKRVSR